MSNKMTTIADSTREQISVLPARSYGAGFGCIRIHRDTHIVFTRPELMLRGSGYSVLPARSRGAEFGCIRIHRDTHIVFTRPELMLRGSGYSVLPARSRGAEFGCIRIHRDTHIVFTRPELMLRGSGYSVLPAWLRGAEFGCRRIHRNAHIIFIRPKKMTTRADDSRTIPGGNHINFTKSKKMTTRPVSGMHGQMIFPTPIPRVFTWVYSIEFVDSSCPKGFVNSRVKPNRVDAAALLSLIVSEPILFLELLDASPKARGTAPDAWEHRTQSANSRWQPLSITVLVAVVGKQLSLTYPFLPTRPRHTSSLSLSLSMLHISFTVSRLLLYSGKFVINLFSVVVVSLLSFVQSEFYRMSVLFPSQAEVTVLCNTVC
ncbi:hypothetical protein J6590_036640 [Homalodisca vitripennis]|nr:hypothetical protein J6590_036640 [Homalodisca vitripennis]